MGPNHGGLSEEQQNDCRAALHDFAERHGLSEWGMVVKVEETASEKYCVKIEITPPADSGLPKWPIQEIAVADAAFDVAAEVDKTLELAFQAAFPNKKKL
jgi:hypothetical protein